MTVSLVLLVGITVVAVIGAPLIFGLYTLDPSGTVDPDQFREVGTLLTRIFLAPDLLLRGDRARQRAAQLPPPVLRRGVEPDPAQPHHHRLAALAPRRRQHGVDVGRRARRRPGALDARARRHRRHRGDGDRADPGRAPGRRALPAQARLPAPRGAPPPDVVGMDARVRRRQPGRDRGRAQPRRSRVGRRQRLLRRLHVLRPPPRAPGDVDRDDVRARDGPQRRAQGPRRVHRADVARRTADRPAHRARPRSSSSSCAGRSSVRSCNTASTRRRPPTTRRGRSPASPSA